eukprot:m.213602 g.213602  ORF g.213602 m.213602 type:complete len:134 (+) comp39793_c0_seq13:150-551(+)
MWMLFLVTRFLREYQTPPDGLSRHRCLFTTPLFNIELLYYGRGKAIILSVGGKSSHLEGGKSWIPKVEQLRQFFEVVVRDVRKPGMSGFSYEMKYCLGKPVQGTEVLAIMKTSLYKWFTNDGGDQWFVTNLQL